MRRVGLGCLLIIVSLGAIVSIPVSANDSNPWVYSRIIRMSETSLSNPPIGSSGCSGALQFIEMSTEGNFPACVYGVVGGFRLARYYDQDSFRYAVSYASEVKFYELRGACEGSANCFYSQAHDTAILYENEYEGKYDIRYVSGFSRQLVRHKHSAGTHFTLSSGVGKVLSGDVNQIKGRSAAMSPDGQWGVIEVPEQGIVRVEMKTGAMRWLISLDPELGISAEPLHLAISNHGSTLGVAGWSRGIELYDIDDSCGYETLNHSGANWCSGKEVDRQTVSSGFSFAFALRFSDDGRKLSLIVDSDESLSKVFLTPEAYESNGAPSYLAFGDSFTSGEGELEDTFYLPDTNTRTNRCHVSNRSYPYLLGGRWDIATTNHACSGSRIPDVRQKSTKVFASTREFPNVVSLSVGGNDIDLIGKLKSCLGPGTCEWALPGKRTATINEMKRLFTSLSELVSDLQRNSSAPIFLVGYPRVINPNASAQCDPIVSSLLSAEERLYIDESIRYLNTIIKGVAQFTNVAYVDIEDAFDSERLCDVKPSSMNAIRLGDDIAPLAPFQDFKIIGAESFHPTPRGHQRIASILEDGLRSFWQSPTCANCQGSLSPSEYWSVGATFAEHVTIQYSLSFIKSAEINAGSAVDVQFIAGVFDPGTTVTFELHSEPQILNSLKVSQDGSLDGKVVLPKETTGYHTLHAKGISYSGELLDIYQTLYVDSLVASAYGSGLTVGGGATKANAAITSTKPHFVTPIMEGEGQVLGINHSKALLATPAQSIQKNSQLTYLFVLSLFVVLSTLVIISVLLLVRRV